MDDLKILWKNSVEIYDAYHQETFTLKAMLLWTINDFTTYGKMCACTFKGYYNCLICGEGTSLESLKHSRRITFTGRRRFLLRHHPYRK